MLQELEILGLEVLAGRLEAVDFLELILVYILFSWFPIREGSIFHDIGLVLQSLCEPYLGIFRRIIPPMGGIDFSPVIAVIALNLVAQLVIGIIV